MELNKEKKSSIIRRQLPAVRQTRTSAYRILKANPLMMHDLDSVKRMGIQNVNTIPKTVDILGISSKTNEISLASQSNINCTAGHQNNTAHNANLKLKTSALQTSKKTVYSLCNKNSRVDTKLMQNNNKILKSKSVNMYNKEASRTSISAMYREKMKAVRRSRSVEDFNPNKCIKRGIDKNLKTKLETSCSLDNIPHHFGTNTNTVKPTNKEKEMESLCKIVGFTGNVLKEPTDTIVKKYKLRRSRSAETDSSKNSKPKIVDKVLQISNSVEDFTEKGLDSSVSPIKRDQPLFKTPLAYKRRSIAQRTPGSYRKSSYNIHNSTPAPADLQKRLNDWLNQHNKSLSSFHHLKCFGLHDRKTDLDKFNDMDNKENRDTQAKTTENVYYVNVITCTKDYDIIARDALNDLHKLIQDVRFW